MPSRKLPECAVCVPARNEEHCLPGLLNALSNQVVLAPMRLTLCVLLDGCDDGSEDVLQRSAPSLPYALRWQSWPVGTSANAGHARRGAMRLGRVAVADRADSVLLTTDADTEPAMDWLAANLRSLERCDIVAGRIQRQERWRHPDQDRLERYYDRLYAYRRVLDPLPWEDRPGHHYTSGASLAFRCSTYDALGGFPPLASGEDGAFVDAAERAGWRVRRDHDVTVTTSARHDGRAPNGLAQWLQIVATQGATAIRVTHPEDLIWRYRGQALARTGFASACFGALASFIGLDADHLVGVARDCPNASAFATRVVPEVRGGERTVSLPEAEIMLDQVDRMSEVLVA